MCPLGTASWTISVSLSLLFLLYFSFSFHSLWGCLSSHISFFPRLKRAVWIGLAYFHSFLAWAGFLLYMWVGMAFVQYPQEGFTCQIPVASTRKWSNVECNVWMGDAAVRNGLSTSPWVELHWFYWGFQRVQEFNKAYACGSWVCAMEAIKWYWYLIQDFVCFIMTSYIYIFCCCCCSSLVVLNATLLIWALCQRKTRISQAGCWQDCINRKKTAAETLRDSGSYG